jgi:hypothetical protein
MPERDLEDGGAWVMALPDGPRISELFRVPDRYLRSVHLERDFEDVASLRDYIVTPSMAPIFKRVLEGIHPGSRLRAWRVTGDYGTGKSSFALALAHLLRDPGAASVAGVRQVIGSASGNDDEELERVRLTPVLVTGARAPLSPSIYRAIGVTLQRLKPRGRAGKELEQLRDRTARLATDDDAGRLLELLEDVSNYAASRAMMYTCSSAWLRPPLAAATVHSSSSGCSIRALMPTPSLCRPRRAWNGRRWQADLRRSPLTSRWPM